MNKIALMLGTLALAGASSMAMAQATPAGVWRTIDDETKAERSVVRISEAGGVFSGKIEKITDPTKQDAKCEKCEGAKKDARIVGLSIIEGVKKNPDEVYWDGGTILDPNNGTTYKVRLTLKNDGKQLDVRGSFGPFGRTQTWIRVE